MLNRFTSRVIFSGLVAASLLLGACAVSPENRAKQGPAAVKLNAGQGLVALQITGNRYGQSTFSNKGYSKYTTVVVRNLDTKAQFTLADRSDPGAGFSFFSDALSPGQYEVLSIQNGSYIAYSPTLAVKQKYSQLPFFRVAPGQLSDLGSVVFMSLLSAEGRGLFRIGLVDTPLDKGAVARLLPSELASQLTGRPTASWEAGPSSRDEWVINSEVRKESMRLASPTLMADGSVLFGEALGQIAQRNKTGVWSWLQTPTTLPIAALHAKSDGALFAGTDGGGLYTKSSGSRVWNTVALPISDAAVLYIGPYLNTKKILVVMQTRDRYVGVSADPLAAEVWSTEFSVPRKFISNPLHDGIAVPLGSGEKFVLATGSVEVKPEVTFYNKAQKSWQTVPVEDGNSPRGWKALPNGDIGRFKGIPLTGMYFAASSDQGVHWEKRGDINWANGSLLFVSDKVGYVVRTESTPAFVAAKGQYAVWKTTDAGSNWVQVGPVPTPTPFGELISLGAPDALAFVAWDGTFHVTADGGKTWKLDRDARY